MKAFALSRIPSTYIGKGSIEKLNDIVKASCAKSILLVTGKGSFVKSKFYPEIRDNFNKLGIRLAEARVEGEPSPFLIDKISDDARNNQVELVIAIGGGSVLDAGKAVSAMIPLNESVLEYLEGVGTKQHSGIKVPFVAVPTTSGTGSEATKNAVLSNVGESGFKKSLRHENFVPDYAILDPDLTVNCPALVTAASGMDALNQLLEGYLSIKANPFTDALAISGISRILSSIEMLVLETPDDIQLRENMAYGAYLSGIVLANAGLGYVHGFAGVIGGMLPIPHGVVCGKLNAPVFELLTNKVIKEKDKYKETYMKMQNLSELLPDCKNKTPGISDFTQKLYELDEKLKLPSLKNYGLTESKATKILSASIKKECPVELNGLELLDKIIKQC